MADELITVWDGSHRNQNADLLCVPASQAPIATMSAPASKPQKARRGVRLSLDARLTMLHGYLREPHTVDDIAAEFGWSYPQTRNALWMGQRRGLIAAERERVWHTTGCVARYVWIGSPATGAA